jgi:hypothetical protein
MKKAVWLNKMCSLINFRFPQRGVIYRADKSEPRLPTVIRRGLNATVNDILVFSKEQQKGKNLCSVNNGGCEELCFFTGLHNRTCACAHGILSKDGQTCDGETENRPQSLQI